MISYHPDSRFLTDFASANLSLAESVCVSAHLELCAKCRAHVQQLKGVAAHLLAQLPGEELEEESFARLMSRIDSKLAAEAAQGAASAGSEEDVATHHELPRALQDAFIPRSLRRLSNAGLQRLHWAQLGKALRVAPLPILGETRETALYDIKAGGRMPEHEHRGEEITVLLKGSFSDADGSYSRGDFVVRNAGEIHQPTATQDTDCICLVCLERPVRPRGLFYRLVEPLVQYRLHRLNRNTAF